MDEFIVQFMIFWNGLMDAIGANTLKFKCYGHGFDGGCVVYDERLGYLVFFVVLVIGLSIIGGVANRINGSE